MLIGHARCSLAVTWIWNARKMLTLPYDVVRSAFAILFEVFLSEPMRFMPVFLYNNRMARDRYKTATNREQIIPSGYPTSRNWHCFYLTAPSVRFFLNGTSISTIFIVHRAFMHLYSMLTIRVSVSWILTRAINCVVLY